MFSLCRQSVDSGFVLNYVTFYFTQENPYWKKAMADTKGSNNLQKTLKAIWSQRKCLNTGKGSQDANEATGICA